MALSPIAQFLSANPSADPKELLSVVVAETERLKEENAAITLEYKETSEVELDANLNFRPKTLAQLQRLARMYAESGIVPDHYAVGKEANDYAKKVAACAIGIQMAMRCKVDILTFLQCSFTHKGKIGIESKLAMAMLNTSGKIDGRVHYRLEGEGKNRRCTASAVDSQTGETFSQTVDWGMVEAEGWHLAKGTQKSKWMTLPDLMFQYRAGIFLARVHYSDVLLGMYTVEELEDMAAGHGAAASPAAGDTLDDLSTHIGARLKPGKKRRSPDATGTTTPAGIAANDPSADGTTTEGDSGGPQPAETPTAPRRSAAPATQPTPAAAAGSAAARPLATQRPPVRPAPATGNASPARTAAPQSSAPSPTAAVAGEPRKPAISIEGLKSYIRLNYPDDHQEFDVDSIAKKAVAQANPQGYCDAMLKRQNANWPDFYLQQPGDETSQLDPAAEEFQGQELDDNRGDEQSQEPAADEIPADLPPNAPSCVLDPIARPAQMSSNANFYEQKINGYKQAARVKAYSLSEIKGNRDLTNEEEGYLLDLCDRRAWLIENDPREKSKSLPGME